MVSKGEGLSSGYAQQFYDEIDIVEFFQSLWREKMFITVFTLLCFLGSAVYAFMLTPAYRATVVLVPPPIFSFGPLVRGGELPPSAQGGVLEQALGMADGAMDVFKRNLMSNSLQQEFFAKNIKFQNVSINVSEERKGLNFQSVKVSLEGAQRDLLPYALDSFINYATERTADEIKSFLSGVGVDYSPEARDLYRVDMPITLPAEPAKPKKYLIMALGLVLGGMISVFVVLIRLMLTKRSELKNT